VLSLDARTHSEEVYTAGAPEADRPSVEVGVSLGTAWRSHSPALFAFGGDSLIELLSAAVVLCRFRFELNEARAARIAGVLLSMLAAFVALTSILSFLGYREAQRSLVGIGLLVAAAGFMPWLARRRSLQSSVSRDRYGAWVSLHFGGAYPRTSRNRICQGPATAYAPAAPDRRWLGRTARFFGRFRCHSVLPSFRSRRPRGRERKVPGGT